MPTTFQPLTMVEASMEVSMEVKVSKVSKVRLFFLSLSLNPIDLRLHPPKGVYAKQGTLICIPFNVHHGRMYALIHLTDACLPFMEAITKVKGSGLLIYTNQIDHFAASQTLV
jgi:hypothetical protein